MNSTIYLSISALIYTIIIAILFFSKKKIDTAENRIFKKIIIITITSLIVELSILFFIANQLVLFIPIILKIFNICIFSWVYMFGQYAFVISHKEDEINYKQKYKMAYFIYRIFYLITVLALAILPVYLSSETKEAYSYGLSVDLVFIMCGALIFVMLIFLLQNRKNLKHKGYYPVIIFISLMGIIALIQNQHPEVLLANALFGLIVIILYHTIENPDLKMLHEMELAKDMAEKSNRAKSDFLSSMSHEIRTPLNAIVGLSQLNENATSLEETKENSKDIVAASNVLLDIVGNVLDMSKIESGNMEIVNSDYNPYDMFNSIIKIIDYRLKEKNLALNVKIAPDIPTKLYGDFSNMRKVVLNILTNAVKYTKEGHIDLTVNCIIKDDICRLIIAVEDTGRGIKPENINKLFTKFNRLETDRNTTTEGTGLGLAITKHILELMGGSITVQSLYGSGSKFTISINQRMNNRAENIKEETLIKSPVEQKNNNKKVLIVDDNKLNLKVASKLLSQYNLSVKEVSSGQECIDKINKEDYDLIFMDEMMPNMSGTETMKKLKEIGYKRPIVVLTADVELNAKDKYLSYGFDDYLGKPINKKELERVLAKFLKN